MAFQTIVTTKPSHQYLMARQLQSEYALASDVNSFWVLFGAILVFFMQTGFAMLEVGSVQAKNTKNILIKNIFDAAIGSISFWLIGYGMAFGSDEGKFIGTTQVSSFFVPLLF